MSKKPSTDPGLKEPIVGVIKELTGPDVITARPPMAAKAKLNIVPKKAAAKKQETTVSEPVSTVLATASAPPAPTMADSLPAALPVEAPAAPSSGQNVAGGFRLDSLVKKTAAPTMGAQKIAQSAAEAQKSGPPPKNIKRVAASKSSNVTAEKEPLVGGAAETLPTGEAVQETEAAPKYLAHQDIIAKIGDKKRMSNKEMMAMQKDIAALDQEAHIELCRIVLSDPKNKYTVNNYGTYVDLSDCSDNTLWRMSYYVALCLEDVKRKNIYAEAEAENQRLLSENKIFQEMNRRTINFSQNLLHQVQPSYDLNHVPTYEELRQDALRNLQNSAGNGMNFFEPGEGEGEEANGEEEDSDEEEGTDLGEEDLEIESNLLDMGGDDFEGGGVGDDFYD